MTQLRDVARKLCEIRGLDPEEYLNSTTWETNESAAMEEVKRYLDIQKAIEIVRTD